MEISVTKDFKKVGSDQLYPLIIKPENSWGYFVPTISELWLRAFQTENDSISGLKSMNGKLVFRVLEGRIQDIQIIQRPGTMEDSIRIELHLDNLLERYVILEVPTSDHSYNYLASILDRLELDQWYSFCYDEVETTYGGSSAQGKYHSGDIVKSFKVNKREKITIN